jgi:hypothetical protein
MGYRASFFLGFIRALFWSGGWYWRLPLVAALLPAVREDAAPMLAPVGLDQAPWWYFALFALGSLALVCACRIAYLETPRVRFGRLIVAQDDEAVHVRISLRHLSFRPVNVVFRAEARTMDGRRIQDPVNPAVLLTKQRFERWRATADLTPPMRVMLDLEEKELVLCLVSASDGAFTIPHENGWWKLPNASCLLVVSVSGSGVTQRKTIALNWSAPAWSIAGDEGSEIIVVTSHGQPDDES